ncbi:MAG: HEPN domain-containing protein [Nanoarchaeota archaeon]|nr:HEPN domain-containing protein [Nanoarchaeota archaeon]
MREEVKRWWEKSQKDFNNLKFNLKNKRYEEACFFAQQSVEKGLKALDIKISNKFIKTHDLKFLAERVKAPEDVIKKCIKINPIYTESRYPDFIEIETYTKEKSEEILSFTKEILKWIKKELNI